MDMTDKSRDELLKIINSLQERAREEASKEFEQIVNRKQVRA